MNKKYCLSLLIALLASGCTEKMPLTSGIDLEGMDHSVRPQDDFYEYANGGWLAATEIPADEVGWGSYMTLRKESLEQSKAIVIEAAKKPGSDAGKAKIGDYYNAYMDVARIEQLSTTPIAGDLAAIDKLATHSDIAGYFGRSNAMGVDAPFNLYVGQDDKDATSYAMFFIQSGLGLPDRDYYTDQSERGRLIIERYKAYIVELFAHNGEPNGAAAAERIFALESKLAAAQWSKVDNRDADKVYNKYTRQELAALLSNLDLDQFLKDIGAAELDYAIVSQPSYMKELNMLFEQTDVATWKDYLRLQLTSSFAPYLSSNYVDSHFEFYSKTLSGRQQQQSRWRKAVRSINRNLGELVR
jgi:predicted metalloendopeptidase